MTELAVPEPGDPKPVTLLLTNDERQREHLFAYQFALEYGRIRGLGDARAAAQYAAQVVDNSRALAGKSVTRHIDLLRGQLAWLRSLPVGSQELKG